jgi:hypothetical protein
VWLPATEQPPQLLGSAWVSEHVAAAPTPQRVPPVAQLHAPAVQMSPWAQALVQLPQWAGSAMMEVQVVAAPAPQMVSPVGQLHSPEAQE